MATYNLVMTGSVVLASLFAFLAIRRYVPGVLAPAAGGFVYGFSPYVLGHLLGHANLVTSAITPPLVFNAVLPGKPASTAESSSGDSPRKSTREVL